MHFTDVSYTENEPYNIVDCGKDSPHNGAGKSGDEEPIKVIYEEVIGDFWTAHWTE